MQFTPPHYQSLQAAAQYRGLRKLLRRSTIGFLTIALIFLSIGITVILAGNNREKLVGIVCFVIGSVFLIQALATLFYARPWLFITQAVILLLIGGFYVLGVCGLALQRSAEPIIVIIWFPLLFIVWGISSISRYQEYRYTPSTPPPADMLAWLDSTIKTLRKAKPANDMSVIEFRTIRGSLSQIVWRGRIAPDSLTITDKRGGELFILGRHGIGITPGRKVFLRRNLLHAEIYLNNKRNRGFISPQSFERFLAWQNSAPAPMVQDGPLWVPRAF